MLSAKKRAADNGGVLVQRIVYLVDIDGVLISFGRRNSAIAMALSEPGIAPGSDEFLDGCFDEVCMANLQSLVSEPNEYVALASNSGLRNFCEGKLQREGLGEKYIGAERNFTGFEGDALMGQLMWVAQRLDIDFGRDRFVIVTDDPVDEKLMPFTVKTNPWAGLTSANVVEARAKASDARLYENAWGKLGFSNWKKVKDYIR